MKNILLNWKTSLLGSGVLTAGITYFINNPSDWKHAIVLCATGLLGLFAADGKNTTNN